MLSMPPATTRRAEPARMASTPNITAFMAEPHILLTVTQPALTGRPAPREACRAGACPWPAGNTQPMMVSSTSAGATPARSKAALMATAPNAGAGKLASSP